MEPSFNKVAKQWWLNRWWLIVRTERRTTEDYQDEIAQLSVHDFCNLFISILDIWFLQQAVMCSSCVITKFFQDCYNKRSYNGWIYVFNVRSYSWGSHIGSVTLMDVSALLLIIIVKRGEAILWDWNNTFRKRREQILPKPRTKSQPSR